MDHQILLYGETCSGKQIFLHGEERVFYSVSNSWKIGSYSFCVCANEAFICKQTHTDLSTFLLTSWNINP